LYYLYMKGRAFVGLIAGFFVLIVFVVPPSVFAGNPPDQGKSTISGTSVPADGLTSSKVTIVLRDSSGNTLPGNDSMLITSSNSSTSFNPSSVTLDGSGIIYTQMKSSFVGSVPVTVTDNSTSNAQITGYVAFYQPGTTPPSLGACTDPAPGSTAQLTSAVSSGANSITLTWIDASNPVTYYLVSYGLSSGNYIYGNPNIGGQGTTSFTVGGLTTGKKYFFVVRAGNGCMPGVFSHEVSAVAGASPTPTFIPPDTSADTAGQSDSIPTDTPQLPADTQTPTPTEVIMPTPVLTSGSDSFVSRLMIGATALGVVCAIVAGVLYLRMNKR
jgi:hypothetical protein